MTIIRPFKALRPVPELVEKVACKPYDVLDADEARAEAEGNPYSFYHVIKPEIDFPKGFDEHDKLVYAKGKENLLQMVKDGILLQDKQEQYYVYKLKMGKHSQYAIIGLSAVREYLNNTIKKHELTRPDKEEDRSIHLDILNAHTEPVFFTYKAVKEIDEIVANVCKQKPVYHFVADDKVEHSLWIIADGQSISKINTLFEQKVNCTYIADGHHRTAAAMRVAALRNKQNPKLSADDDANYFLTAFFPHNQVQIFDYNRVVKDLNGLSTQAFVEALKYNYHISHSELPYKPEKEFELGMYLDGKWYKMELKKDFYPKGSIKDKLDVSVFSKYILEPLLNITDLRKDKRIEFVGGIRGLSALQQAVDSGKMKAAFALYPCSLNQLMEIADKNEIMPPKTTWFEPKLRSGLFIHTL